jgi:FAD/FMN-containing dehydrogenase
MRLWNAAITTHPTEVVTCGNVDDVRSALSRARQHGRPVSVLGGGHDWAGRAVREGGLVIDLSGLREVTVDGDTATAGGGVTAGDVMAAAHQHGQSAVAGNVGAVGMAGLALGGGYGPLVGLAGLAADTVVGAEVVLADGRVVRTGDFRSAAGWGGDEAGPELLWALRGGGGNFGVVTALRLRLQPVLTVLAGTIAFGWAQAAAVLSGWGELAAGAPDDLTVQSGSICLPDGSPVVFLNPVWSGDPADGESWIKRLAALGAPIMNNVAPVTPLDLLRRGDQLFAADGRHYALGTCNLSALTADVVAALVEAGEARTSPLSGISIHHFHGAATRIGADATAFGERRPHFMAELVGSWRPGDGSAEENWGADAVRGLRPYALPGGYPNLLAPDDERMADAYGPNAARLAEVKRAYDPDGVFGVTPGRR